MPQEEVNVGKVMEDCVDVAFSAGPQEGMDFCYWLAEQWAKIICLGPWTEESVCKMIDITREQAFSYLKAS